MTTFLASHLKRKKRDGPASSLINSLKCSLLKERITEKRKRASRFGYPRLKAQRRDTETKNLPYLYN